MQPVGSTQGNARAQVDLPASLMLINTHALVHVGQSRSNAHARVYLQSCVVMRVREQIYNPRAQFKEMRVRE